MKCFGLSDARDTGEEGEMTRATFLEERKAFHGLDKREMEEKRGSHMGEPKVEQYQNFHLPFVC